MSEGFFERWSRRKQQERAPEAPAPIVPAAPEPSSPVAAQAPTVPAHAPEKAADDAAPPLPTLADAQALTPDADFAPFVARGVAPEVRNLALKKLFADPHFNVMDGLDTYIGDYNKPSPIAPAVLRQLASARALKLFDDAEPDMQDLASSAAGAPVAEAPAFDAAPSTAQKADETQPPLTPSTPKPR